MLNLDSEVAEIPLSTQDLTLAKSLIDALLQRRENDGGGGPHQRREKDADGGAQQQQEVHQQQVARQQQEVKSSSAMHTNGMVRHLETSLHSDPNPVTLCQHLQTPSPKELFVDCPVGGPTTLAWLTAWRLVLPMPVLSHFKNRSTRRTRRGRLITVCV